MAQTEERDHIDRWMDDAWLEDMPFLDLEVEGIVDRMNGLNRRIRRSQNAAIAEQGLTFEEWHVLGALRQAGPPFQRSAGWLAKRTDLSSGAMTNRLDRLEKAGLVRRLPDPDDRRGVIIELTDDGEWASFMPHGDRVILGGIAVEHDWSRVPSREVTAGILRRCAAVEPRLAEAEVQEEVVGLRPGRHAVRLECEHYAGARIVHNYGHGGSGVALSWGCAFEAASLVEE